MSAACVGIARTYVQRCSSISRSASSGFQRLSRTPGRAVEQHREVAEDEAADEAELDDGRGRCPRRSAPSARTRPRSRSAGCWSSARCPSAPTSCPTSAGPARGRRRGAGCASAGRSCAARRRRPPAGAVSSSRRSPATLRHFAISFSPPKLTIARRLRLLDQGRQLGLVEHRRQRREHHAAVQAPEHRDRRLDRVAAQQDHDLAGLDAGLREAVGHADRGAAELGVGDRAVVEDQRDPVGVLLRARVEVAPEVARLASSPPRSSARPPAGRPASPWSSRRLLRTRAK